MRSLAVSIAVSVAVSAVLVTASCAGPAVAPPHGRSVEHTPERLARGRYLATNVTACLGCHSTRDEARFGAPPVAGSEGKGGDTMTKETHGVPGTLVAPNITPAALSGWSDGEIDRALTVGVSKDGRALFPIMPYPSYAHLCQDDVDALVAWLRTLAPIAHAPPATSLSFPMSMIVNSIPKDTPRPACPPSGAGVDDERARGAYLVAVAGCVECHSPVERGQVVAGKEFAGGRTFTLPTGKVTSPNLTTTGALQSLDAAVFVATFRAHAEAAVVEPGAMQTNMPWTSYAGMTDADLQAIHAYLSSVPPQTTPENAPPRWAAKPTK